MTDVRSVRLDERIVEEPGPPRLRAAWEDDPVVIAVTTAARDFGATTDTPARSVSGAWRELRAWAAGRFRGVIGASQVHGGRIFAADGVEVPESAAGAAPWGLRLADYDGFTTAEPGILLTIGIADCVPAVLRGPRGVALLHAGWRGAAADIVPGAVAALGERYGDDPAAIRAWWGPSIGPCHYPVGAEVVEAIGATAAGRERPAWAERDEDGRWRVDLRAALSAQARAAGVPEGAIAASTACTACEPTFHSYRRADGGGGRMVAVAGIPTDAAPPDGGSPSA